jgi:5-formyltetrahydrofolate cyclo-ligase
MVAPLRNFRSPTGLWRVPMSVAAPAPAVRKRALRAECMARRAAIDDNERRRATKQALLNLVAALPLEPDSIVAAFWPLGAELDTRPLFNALGALGITTCLPRMAGKGQPLAFHRYRPGDALLEGPMRVFEPLPAAPALCPTIAVVPMLAFDDAGFRLGYGGGFYDRTLPTLGPALVAIGLAFEAQRLAALPREANDVRLRCIVTEVGVHHFP